jgi:hypothetical protein
MKGEWEVLRAGRSRHNGGQQNPGRPRLDENRTAACKGGKIAGDAKKDDLEKETGKRIATSENYLSLTESAKRTERRYER